MAAHSLVFCLLLLFSSLAKSSSINRIQGLKMTKMFTMRWYWDEMVTLNMTLTLKKVQFEVAEYERLNSPCFLFIREALDINPITAQIWTLNNIAINDCNEKFIWCWFGCSISFAPVTDVKIQLHVFITTAPPQYCYFGMLKSESGVTLVNFCCLERQYFIILYPSLPIQMERFHSVLSAQYI